MRFLSFLVGVALALAGVGLGAFTVVRGGLYDARASTPHLPVVDWATHEAFIRSTRRQADAGPPPPALTPERAQRGFLIYERECVGCHGGPATARAPWTRGMTPTPPYLLDAAVRWSPKELYWIVGHGVKMTGMPAWERSLGRDGVWDVVAFLAQLRTLPPGDYLAMRQRPVTPARATHRPPGS